MSKSPLTVNPNMHPERDALSHEMGGYYTVEDNCIVYVRPNLQHEDVLLVNRRLREANRKFREKHGF